MIGRLFFEAGTEQIACYVLDISGNLIRCSPDGSPDSLIPFSVEVVTPVDELLYPKPWSLRLTEIEERIRLAAPPVGLYPNGSVSQTALPFAEPSASDPGPHKMVDEAMDLAAKVKESRPDAYGLLQARLAKLGIFPIPCNTSFNDLLHETDQPIQPGAPVQIVADGWFSNRHIFRKALVTSLS